MSDNLNKVVKEILDDFYDYAHGKKNSDGTDWNGDYPTSIGRIKQLINNKKIAELEELTRDDKQELLSGEWGAMVVVPIDYILNRIATLKKGSE